MLNKRKGKQYFPFYNFQLIYLFYLTLIIAQQDINLINENDMGEQQNKQKSNKN